MVAISHVVTRMDLPTDWHKFAEEYGKCFVTMENNRWKAYLPDGATFLAYDLDVVRAEVSKYNCTLLF